MILFARLVSALYMWLAPVVVAMAASSAPWPVLPLPPGAQVIDMSAETVTNGTPTRTRGFVVQRPAAEVAETLDSSAPPHLHANVLWLRM